MFRHDSSLHFLVGLLAQKSERDLLCACQSKGKFTPKMWFACHQPETKNIPIPRGNKRAQLAEMGLIGKVSINTVWGAEEVAKEITSVFSGAFSLQPGDVLDYDYLGYVIIMT